MSVLLQPRARAGAGVVALDLDTRSRAEKSARRIVRRAFSGRAAKHAAILFKKIDSTLRGHVAAELAAASRALGSRRSILFAPAFPAQGRIVRDSRLVVNGKPSSGNLRELLPGIGARGLVCDATTDADLDRIARAGLAMRPRPLFVGSAGLARALARTLPARRPAPRPRTSRRAVVTVVGSASPVSKQQARQLSRDRSALLVQMAWTREPQARDIPAVRRLGRLVAQSVPQAHYVLTGGETARAVLGARKIRALRLLGEVEPGVPFGIATDGTLVCTKAGAFGGPGTLVKCVARLKREMTKS